MIQKRYPRDEAPEFTPESERRTLIFYCNDEVIPLNDPRPNVTLDMLDTDVGPATDVVAGTVTELRALLSPPTSDGFRQTDDIDDGVFEVYGPSKRPRHSIEHSDVNPMASVRTISQIQDDDPEEMLDHTGMDDDPELWANQTDQDSAMQPRYDPSVSVLPAANAHADTVNDGSLCYTR